MRRLFILSDLYGFHECKWIEKYEHRLSSHFEVILIDSTEIAQIDSSSQDQDIIHRQFLECGIVTAVKYLIETIHKGDFILGFSFGGYLAYKALSIEISATYLIAVSSTRIRKETSAPACETHIIFGGLDLYTPSSTWFDQVNIKPTIMENNSHTLYQSDSMIDKICQDLIDVNLKHTDSFMI